jgi:hypothetical protein
MSSAKAALESDTRVVWSCTRNSPLNEQGRGAVPGNGGSPASSAASPCLLCATPLPPPTSSSCRASLCLLWRASPYLWPVNGTTENGARRAPASGRRAGRRRRERDERRLGEGSETSIGWEKGKGRACVLAFGLARQRPLLVCDFPAPRSNS